jgi:hypothetical protein
LDNPGAASLWIVYLLMRNAGFYPPPIRIQRRIDDFRHNDGDRSTTLPTRTKGDFRSWLD